MDLELVQVKASKSELEKRITAFTSHKRSLLDAANCLEFRGEGGAARVAATLARSRGSRGHLRRSKVDNQSGPKVYPDEIPKKIIKLDPDAVPMLPIPLENRISELENRVFFREQDPLPPSLYQRLRILENRVLELEGLSPEHCRPMEVVRTRDREQDVASKKEARRTQVAADLKNINGRIAELRHTLKAKTDPGRQ